MKKQVFGIGFLVVLLLPGACVTQKKKGEEVGGFTRGYHNVTTRYNYWFNADELFRTTLAQQAAAYKDNYNQVLPVFPETEVDPQPTQAKYDEVIKKSAYGISLHRPGDWLDDCYTLVGQSQFMKKDFETAENTFRYIREEHNPKTKLKKGKKKSEVKKKKKKKKNKKRKKKKKSAKKRKKEAEKKKKQEAKEAEKAAKKAAKAAGATDPNQLPVLTENPYKSKKGSSRTSAYPLAMVWYGRTLVERDKQDEAEILFRELAEDPWFPKEFRQDLAMAEADMWISEKRYDRAIKPLQEALEYTDKKKEKARLAYILAQIHEQNGNYEAAYAALEVALNSKPTFEMEFNAQLHLVQAGWANKKISSAEANRELERMAKETKNFDYRDQIYYVLATIALADGLKNDAIAYLEWSLAYSKGNAAQRAESYLKLADLYFESEAFVRAKNYYDSTLTVLGTTDERYNRVKGLSENLTEIARLLTTIAANDSIVRVYNMSDAERRELARRIKRDRENELAAQNLKEGIEAQAPANAPPTPTAGSKPSSFYFYNESFFKKGQRDFERDWGPRKLEDNWRRSNRLISGLPGEETPEGADSTFQANTEDKELDDVFKSIPKTEAEIAVINLSSYEAMYELGILYRDKLQSPRLSTDVLEEMQKRYPDINKYEKETWYYCYLGFTDLGNKPRAQYYFDKLTTQHPKSTFARALTDPNFANATKAREMELNKYYEETFQLFQNGAYKEAYDRCQDAPKKFGTTNPLMPKFTLLSAICTGNIEGNEAYCKALNEVIARYPDSDESTRAKEIARLIACKGFEVTGKPGEKDKTPGAPSSSESAFSLDDDKLHYFLVVLNGKDVSVNDAKSAISDYNREFHKLEQIRTSNIFLGSDTETPIIVLRKFDNKEQAMRYYDEVKDRPAFLKEGDKKINKEFFAITQENYRVVLKNRTLDGYRAFFEENYLK